MANESVRTPGVMDVMHSETTFRDPKRVEQAAENVAVSVGCAIRGIGQLLWVASLSKEDVRPVTLGDIGTALEMLADMAGQVDALRSNAAFQQLTEATAELQRIKGEFVEVPVYGRVPDDAVAP